MGSVGDAYDNAMCESFFATLECELLARSRFKTPSEARSALSLRFTQVWVHRDGRWLREAFEAILADPLAPQIAASVSGDAAAS